jgi:hypothetical protein
VNQPSNTNEPPRSNTDIPNERLVDASHENVAGIVRNVSVGSAVLFAFLLATPLSSKTAAFNLNDRIDYYISFFCSALSLIFVLAPSIYPLSQWSQQGWSWHNIDDKRWSARSVLLGTWLLGAAMAGSIYLVVDVTLGTLAATIALSFLIAAVALAWFLPMLAAHRKRNRMGPPEVGLDPTAD